MIAEVLANRYTILDALGEGAMGQVWLAEDSTSDRLVALKVLLKSADASEKAILQLQQEFRMMTHLRHPNCCAVYDYGRLPDGAPYFTMEVVPGKGLHEILPLDAERFRQVLSQLLLALGYVHQQGYVHRDIKSMNVRIRPDGVVKLMDFGLMDVAGRSGATISGTPAYISPEVIKRGPVDQRADLYSVGCLAFEMLVGEVPFAQEKTSEVLRAQLQERPPRPCALKPDLDPALERIVLKLLAKEPTERYQSAYEVLEDLGVEVPAGIGGNLLAAPMIGREGAWQALTEGLARVLDGKGGMAHLVWGSAGIGKSRLMEEFRFAVRLENLPCGLGALPEHGHAPYGPFISLLRSLLPELRAHVPELLQTFGNVLVKLLPELGVPAAPVMDPPSKEKLRLMATITELLLGLANARGLVVILEDWHWADPLSREMLDYLLRNAQEAPLMLVVTARHGAEKLLAELGDWMRPLPLAGLEQGETQRMLAAMLGSNGLGEGFVQLISEFSAGNPYLIERLLEHLVQNGTLVSSQGRWNTEVPIGRESLPAGLHELLLEELALLPEFAQRLARIAAVMGRECPLDILKQVSELDDEALFDALDALRHQHVFIQGEDGSLLFAQDQLQELLYEQLDAAERTRLHTRVAHALEDRIGDRPLFQVPLDQVALIAHHFLNSDEVEKQILYALETGTRHAMLFANEEAERFLSRGLALLRGPEREALTLDYLDDLELDFLRQLADVQRLMGQSEPATATYAEAIALAETLDERFLLGRLLTSLGKAQQMLGQQDAARVNYQQALAIAESLGDRPGMARTLLNLSRQRYFAGNLDTSLADAERALAIAREARDQAHIAEALAFIGYLCVAAATDRRKEGVDKLHLSIGIFDEQGDKHGLINAYELLGNAQLALGDLVQAWDSFLLNQKLTYEVGRKEEEVYAFLNLAITMAELGNFTACRARAEVVVERASAQNAKLAYGMGLTLLALAEAHTGKPAQAAGRLEEVLTLARETRNTYLETFVLPYLIELALFKGRLEQAARHVEALTELLRESGNTEPECLLACFRAELAGRRGEPTEGVGSAEWAIALARAAQTKSQLVRALKTRAWLALQAEDWEMARSMAEEGRGLAQQIGAKYRQAELEGLLGELALATGQAEAAERFKAMATLAQETDAPGLRAIALFGQAAADPYHARASEWAATARDWLAQAGADLSEAAQAEFLSLQERKRVSEGNFIGFSLPRVDLPKPNSRLGLSQGLWKF